MASEQTNNTNDFLNELSFEKPDHIKLEIEKNMIEKRRRVLKKSAESLEDRIRRLVAEHRAVKMKITLADGQLQYIQEQMDESGSANGSSTERFLCKRINHRKRFLCRRINHATPQL